MNDLLETTLFRLFVETSHEVTYDEIKSAYLDFVHQVETISNSEPDYTEVMQHLNLARIELASIESVYWYIKESNVLKKGFIRKAMAFIDSELDLLKLKIQYPKQFQSANPQASKIELYLIPKSREVGIIGMAEIVISLYHSNEIVGTDGKPVSLVQLANAFEQMFNFSFGSIYDKRNAIFNRKPYNLTKTLDMLRETILREDKKRGSQ